jgi:cytochrome c553
MCLAHASLAIEPQIALLGGVTLTANVGLYMVSVIRFTFYVSLIIVATLAEAIGNQEEKSNGRTIGRPGILAVYAYCHGFDGAGRDVETPNLAGQSGIYLYNQLIAFRSGTRQHSVMTGIVRELTDNEIQQIILYYAILPPP